MLKSPLATLTATILLLGSSLVPARADDQTALPGSFAPGLGTWLVNTMEHTAATAASESADNGRPAVHITVPKAGEKRYYVQLVGKGIPLRGGKTYHLHFRAHGKPACEISVVAGSYHGKFEELWRQDHLGLKEGWADYTCDLTPKADEDAAQIIFGGLAAQAGEYWFADVSLAE